MIGKKQGRAKEKPASKPKLTDAERHKRFVDMAHEVEADETPGSFDQAFTKIIAPQHRSTKNN
jgi:hypothetical protein